MIDRSHALTVVMERGDEWQSWRALRLDGEAPGEMPAIPSQDGEGGFIGPSGRVSPGTTGFELCHLKMLGLEDSGAATIAADWLLEARTPAEAWLDAPDDVPGKVDDPAAGRVWASAAAAAGLLVVDRDPGPRVLMLLRGEANAEGLFTGGAYPTFAAAAAYGLAEGPQTETAEWALRWVREWQEEWWGPCEWTTALTLWGAAGIPPDHPSVEAFLDALIEPAPPEGWPDEPEFTLRALEAWAHLGG